MAITAAMVATAATAVLAAATAVLAATTEVWATHRMAVRKIYLKTYFISCVIRHMYHFLFLS